MREHSLQKNSTEAFGRNGKIGKKTLDPHLAQTVVISGWNCQGTNEGCQGVGLSPVFTATATRPDLVDPCSVRFQEQGSTAKHSGWNNNSG